MFLEELFTREVRFEEDLKELWFDNSHYILCVKDEDWPNRNVLNIYFFREGEVCLLREDLDEHKIVTTPNNKLMMADLGVRFALQELLKISHGTIIFNDRYVSGGTIPKLKTFHTNVNKATEEDVIEIFEGEFNESEGTFRVNELSLNSLIRDVYLANDRFFFTIDKDNRIFGPFRVLKELSDDRFEIEPHFKYKFGRYNSEESAFTSFVANNITRNIFIPRILNPNLIEELEFMTDSQLRNKLEQFISSRSDLITKIDIPQFLEVIRIIGESDNFKSIISSKDRVNKFLENIGKGMIDIQGIVEKIPVFKESESRLEKLKQEELKLNNSIDDLHKSIDALKETRELEMSQISKIIESRKETEDKQRKEIEEVLKELHFKKSNLDKQIQLEYESKSEQIKQLEAQIKYLESKEDSLKLGIKTLIDEFTSEQKSANDKLKELLKQNTHFKILSGIEYSAENEIVSSGSDYRVSDEFDNYTSLRDSVQKQLIDNNRKLKTHELDNLLISIHQNTLTLLGGIPGTGKTTLAKLLTKMLTHEDRTKVVSVARGWTSQKDLIGFYNPLSRKFTPSQTNVFQLLEILNQEVINETFNDTQFSYILLDEANLSPMEHYWSVFYNFTDDVARDTKYFSIDLGNGEKVFYPNNIRFIGTLNFDSTTESISPRVIDRSNIIRIKPNVDTELNHLSADSVVQLKVTFQKMREFFELMDFRTEPKTISFTENNELIYKKVKELMGDLNINISPRVQKDIKHYCSLAERVMHDENKPIDYAIAQRVLTKINNQGEKSREVLIELSNFLKDNSLSISHEIVEDILKLGEEDSVFEDQYNYFFTLSHA